jgi:lactoylglutathione lyase
LAGDLCSAVNYGAIAHALLITRRRVRGELNPHSWKETIMARIVHLALKVDDLEKSSEFYEKLFGFVPVEEGKVRDHTSRHLTDGTIDLALIKYDREESAESLASGEGPCIHHFGIEVENLDQYAAQLARFGCELISDPGVVPIKFRAPGGTVAEIVPGKRYKKPGAKRDVAPK